MGNHGKPLQISRKHIWAKTNADRWGALDEATAQITPKAKCPFTPQREIKLNLWGKNPP
jgi:hypothetical protein